MIAIKGFDVCVSDAATAPETVSNVLVGESTGNGFTLAIPKGDTHNWLDAKVEFFGRTFRTVGYPKEGIDELLPLAWNKQVSVLQLIANADLTVYEKDTYKRHVFKDVLFVDNRGSTVNKTGDRVKGAVEISVYAPNITDSYLPKIGDLVVGSDCGFEFDTASQQALSESFKAFRAAYPAYAVISSVTQTVNAVESDYSITAG